MVCLAALSWGLHIFLSWLHAQVRNAKPENTGVPSAPWLPRWTLSILGIVVLLFVAGIAATGITHQTAWLMSSPQPIVQRDGGSTQIRSVNNLRDIAAAVYGFERLHQHFPPGATFDGQGRLLHSWQTQILPYLDEEAIYKRIDLQQPWNHPSNVPAMQKSVKPFLHPSISYRVNEAGFALSHYAGNVHVLNGDRPLTFNDFTKGTSTTILAGEVNAGFQPWGYPLNCRDPGLGLNSSPRGFGSPDKSGVQFLMADGSIRSFKTNIDPKVLRALSLPHGERVELPD
jgi:hypothetical protein